jgi:hypothetical protein
MFGTSGIKTEDFVSKYLNYGINHCKINGITVIKAKTTESKKVQFAMEGAPMGKDFQGVDGAKGKVGRVETLYMNNDKAYQDFMRQVGVIADKLGVRGAVDVIKASTIEDYIAQVEPLLKGKYAWWMFGGEEWDAGKWKLGLLKFGFVKAESEVDADSLTLDGYIGSQLLNKEGVAIMTFDKKSRFHYHPMEKSEDGVGIGSAGAVAKDLPSFTFPDDLPTSPGSSAADSMDFGPVNSGPSDLPFGNED